MLHDWLALFTKPRLQLSVADEVMMALPIIVLVVIVGVCMGLRDYFREKRAKERMEEAARQRVRNQANKPKTRHEMRDTFAVLLDRHDRKAEEIRREYED